MGIPKFFGFISERYPCILQLIKENQIPDFDNLYLDMNGIFHTCTHPSDNLTLDISEEEMFRNIFHYIDMLFQIIRPKKLLFMAVDGVAPRAKMNQQRARRFRTAKDKELLEKKLINEGKKLPDTPRFDSNCITPGTQFMIKLQTYLEYYVTSRITTNPLWRKCKVILSGHEVPGEGEHKIMEYIRYLKTLPDYDPYTRHCFYGLDADLLMLGLCTHEKNFSILREEVIFGRNRSTVVQPEENKFYLLHLSLLKEYLDLEFQDLKMKLPFEYDLECIVDDWVLMGFIVGNDFIPHLPNFHIAKGAFPVIFKAYIEVLPTLNGYLNEKGYLNLSRFQKFMERLAKHELESFEENYANLLYFAEKTGRKPYLEKEKENGEIKDEELEKLIKATSEELGFMDDELIDDSDGQDFEPDDEDDEDTFFKEFCQHKRNYYTNKLDYLEVTDEVLKSQAEGYIRGLQWILHYYYHGCQSWSWFYPHHYAPCTSDIVNFIDVNLDFEMGKPFLPYEQLLAVLPPASQALVPEAYRHLMISPNSPIKSFYPDDFETDLNGKKHQWEAVVLLPFINENDLLGAMEECNYKLTLAEKLNNKHGPMLIYSYTSDNIGFYRAPKYFTNLEQNHALMESVWREDIIVSKSVSGFNRRNDIDPNLLVPGFPTLRFVPFKASKEKGKVRIFNLPGREESIILSIIQSELPDTQTIAEELLGKNVYVNWPFLTEARVVEVSDGICKYVLTHEGVKKLEMDEKETLNWLSTGSTLTRQYIEKQGIIIGDMKVLISVKTLKGIKKYFETPTVFTSKKIWSETTEIIPLQTTVKDIKVYIPPNDLSTTSEDTFSPGSVVFILSFPYYGCMGKINDCIDKTKSGRLSVTLEVPFESKIDKEFLSQSMSTYYSAYVACQKLGMSQVVIARISGNLFVDITDSTEPDQLMNKSSTVNIGLGLKINKTNEEVPGYTKKENYWMYSKKAIDVINEYVKRYPHVVDFIGSRSRDARRLRWHEIYPEPNGIEKIKEIVSWINSLECSQIKRVSCGSQVLEKDIVLEIEKIIDSSPKRCTMKNIFVKLEYLFKSDLTSGGLVPVPSADHQLFDRVICVNPYYSVPLGLRGYIIGIRKAGSPNDYMYDILYDEILPNGMTLNSSPGRAYKTSKTSFINITHGERAYQLSKQSKLNHVVHSRSTNSGGMLSKERPSSAFAQWTNYPAAPVYADKADQLKTLFSYVEKAKTQDETTVLKKLLKIEDEEKPKIEDSVKTFFENVSKSTEKMVSRNTNVGIENVKLMQKFQEEPGKQSVELLFHYLQSRNLPQAIYHTTEVGDRVISQVALWDGRMYTSLPCQGVDSARDCAAMQALVALGEIQPNKEFMVCKERDKFPKTMENQAKLERGLFRSVEIESSKPVNKSKAQNEKPNRSNKVQQPNHRRSVAPHVLPTPPPQWCRQFKSSCSGHQEQYKNTPNFYKKMGSDASGKNDHINRNQTDNLSGSWRTDCSNNLRNTNWRQDDRSKNSQNDYRSGNDGLRNSNWRAKPSDTSQGVRLRPDIYVPQIKFTQDKAVTQHTQIGIQNNCQRLSAVATEFIPLQALTRNRSRNTQITIAKPIKKNDACDLTPVAPIKLAPVTNEEKVSSSIKHQRKSRIAAKFDADWDK